MKKDFAIGVLGGMGTYATIHLFQQYAELFPAEKEWDRPRIIIDNRCSMPSRVRAFLSNENVCQLVTEMTESMEWLLRGGCSHIILACNTSHLFLPIIYQRVPKIKPHVIHIIDICVKQIIEDKVKTVFLLGSEGTIKSRIYQDALEQNGIECLVPEGEEFILLRECIEAVKQNKYSERIKKVFISLVNRYDTYVLGCTELPILYEKYRTFVTSKTIYDPIYLSLIELKREYNDD